MHSEQTGVLTVDLTREPMAPAHARRAIEGFLAGRCPPNVAQTVLMVGSELVTNAITHTSGGCQLSVGFSDELVVVEVR